MASLKHTLSLSFFYHQQSYFSNNNNNNPTAFSTVPIFTLTRYRFSELHSQQDISRRNNSDHSISPTRYRYSASEEDDDDDENCSFDEAVELFNRREFYTCHDLLEALWNKAEEPSRTLIHGILQCAVGFHHLFNQNHKGAMMELGEGLCKLRKMDFRSGPFHQFELGISQVLDFVYQTQIELAACGDELCVTMDGSERSYQLLGGYGAGQQLYKLQTEDNDENQTVYIVFCLQTSYSNGHPPPTPRVKLPPLNATKQLLEAFDYN